MYTGCPVMKMVGKKIDVRNVCTIKPFHYCLSRFSSININIISNLMRNSSGFRVKIAEIFGIISYESDFFCFYEVFTP